GAFYGEHYARLFMNNSSISGNNAGAAKVIMNLDSSSATLTNSILWGNTSSGAILFDASSSASVSYSIVEGGFSGTNVLNQNPLFADAANGDLHLSPCSPAIDAGDDISVKTEKDLDSNARKIDAINGGNQIDMGAYEFQTLLDADNDGHTLCNGDCDDNNPNVWRTGTFYKDGDGDGYTTGDGESVCYGDDTPAGYSTTKSDTDDCNDDDANVHAPQQYYVDADHDGYGSATTAMLCASTPPEGYSINNTDCDDNNASVWRTGTFYKDADHDGYTTGDGKLLCYGNDTPKGYSATRSDFEDCDDNKASVHPGAKEICGDGIDNNCNGEIDENCTGACAQTPTNPNTTNITSNSARLNWSAPVNPVKWLIRYKKQGSGKIWTLKVVKGSARSFNISSLKANQRYVWQIRAHCGVALNTNFTDKVLFKTLSAQFAGENVQESISVKNDINENAPAIKLYPNPTKGQFVIELHLAGNINANAKIEVMNMTGQIVLHENANISAG
ncbi:MAG TPA: MopE-related protein, partial [Legionellaceae bacterium]|nr:MopE-related protein [Legionellaceae bacterium]